MKVTALNPGGSMGVVCRLERIMCMGAGSRDGRASELSVGSVDST